MYKYLAANNTKTWIDIVHDLLYNYDKNFHRSIKMTLTEASLVKNSKAVYYGFEWIGKCAAVLTILLKQVLLQKSVV